MIQMLVPTTPRTAAENKIRWPYASRIAALTESALLCEEANSRGPTAKMSTGARAMNATRLPNRRNVARSGAADQQDRDREREVAGFADTPLGVAEVGKVGAADRDAEHLRLLHLRRDLRVDAGDRFVD